uniref:Uncharacterized protein n=1 Tax=Chromera velia CCMP2878 TaxID=1169474 RepID=A0A0G4HCY6_9ALVE|eukprot:Cvel_26376.t1-p1 / transcript=Cvel_26376.t1 / gene=Cvel_26376 / organism=Chromera_velia_CCMP2878 / gene_product=hypothetical protein / transcript_product=hypothetical protein / location=Cvel_scaffold3126:5988-7722(-) / protein_length=348 / sequence_SO=supercontig / SO=protein_coding / is_pseudo=false
MNRVTGLCAAFLLSSFLPSFVAHAKTLLRRADADVGLDDDYLDTQVNAAISDDNPFSGTYTSQTVVSGQADPISLPLPFYGSQNFNPQVIVQSPMQPPLTRTVMGQPTASGMGVPGASASMGMPGMPYGWNTRTLPAQSGAAPSRSSSATLSTNTPAEEIRISPEPSPPVKKAAVISGDTVTSVSSDVSRKTIVDVKPLSVSTSDGIPDKLEWSFRYCMPYENGRFTGEPTEASNSNSPCWKASKKANTVTMVVSVACPGEYDASKWQTRQPFFLNTVNTRVHGAFTIPLEGDAWELRNHPKSIARTLRKPFHCLNDRGDPEGDAIPLSFKFGGTSTEGAKVLSQLLT